MFSKWSYPNNQDAIETTIDFAIQLNTISSGTASITVYKNNSSSAAPSKPQNIQVAWSGDHPQLTWESNTEPDKQSYKISKMVEGQTGWATVATVTHDTSLTTHSWTDVNVDKPGKFDPVYTIHYKIRAYDTQSKYSVYSEEKDQ